MTTAKLWTIYSVIPGLKRRMICQYTDETRARQHAASLDIPTSVELASPNPLRKVENRRGVVSKIGVPQY